MQKTLEILALVLALGLLASASADEWSTTQVPDITDNPGSYLEQEHQCFGMVHSVDPNAQTYMLRHSTGASIRVAQNVLMEEPIADLHHRIRGFVMVDENDRPYLLETYRVAMDAINTKQLYEPIMPPDIEREPVGIARVLTDGSRFEHEHITIAGHISAIYRERLEFEVKAADNSVITVKAKARDLPALEAKERPHSVSGYLILDRSHQPPRPRLLMTSLVARDVPSDGDGGVLDSEPIIEPVEPVVVSGGTDGEAKIDPAISVDPPTDTASIPAWLYLVVGALIIGFVVFAIWRSTRNQDDDPYELPPTAEQPVEEMPVQDHVEPVMSQGDPSNGSRFKTDTSVDPTTIEAVQYPGFIVEDDGRRHQIWGIEQLDGAVTCTLGAHSPVFDNDHIHMQLASTSPLLSRRHAELVLRDGQVVLHNLGRNRTVVDGREISYDDEVALADGIRIELADVGFEYRTD